MSIKTIRSIERALTVIETLSQSPSLSLVQLKRKTELDNATLLRILSTLIERGWVRQLIVEKKYELSHNFGAIFGAATWAHPITELATPILLGLKSNPLNLPSDLCAIKGDGLFEIVESTRLRGPMAPVRTSLGIRPSLFKSAHGRAILAEMPPDMRARQIDAFLSGASKEDILLHNQGLIIPELEKTKIRGYGIREPNYWEPPFDDTPPFGAVAVCIKNTSGIFGSLSVLWLEENTSLDHVIDAGMVQILTQAAQKIAQRLADNNILPPV